MSDAWENIEEEDEEEAKPRPVRRRRQPRSEQRGNWYLLTGMIMGLAFGLFYAWIISPVNYVDIDPASLSAGHKDEYRRVIALAYAADHNLGRARERLALLGPDNPVQVLAAQAQRMLAENQLPQEARALAVLAADLARPPSAAGGTPSPQAVANASISETPLLDTLTPQSQTATASISSAVQTPTALAPTRTPTVTLTPLPTFTPRPTATPVLVVDSPFKVKSKSQVCDASARPGLLQVEVTDAKGNPLPGIKIQVLWNNGEDDFYTGLAPDIDPGYADFQMQEKITYSLRVGEVSDVVSALTIPDCGGGWKVVYQETSSH